MIIYDVNSLVWSDSVNYPPTLFPTPKKQEVAQYYPHLFEVTLLNTTLWGT